MSPSGTERLLISLAVFTSLLVACKPPPKHAVSGEIKVEFVRAVPPDLYFQLKNETSMQVAFTGAHGWWWEPVFPLGPQFECVLADPNQMYGNPYPLIDGPAWEKFVIEPGEEIDITVSNYFLRDGEGRLPTGRCRFVLRVNGDTVVKSEEFESKGEYVAPQRPQGPANR